MRVRREGREVRVLRARRSGRDAVGLQEGEVRWFFAGRVDVLEVEIRLQAVDRQGGAPVGGAAAGGVGERREARRVQLEFHEGGSGSVGGVGADIAVAVW